MARDYDREEQRPDQTPGREASPAETSPATPGATRPADEAPAGPAADQGEGKGDEGGKGKGKGGKRKRAPLLIGAILLAGAAYMGYDWLTVGRYMLSTDDAYVEVEFAQIAPKISGYVADVPVRANQRVKAGDPLLKIDDADYKASVAAAAADVASASAALITLGKQEIAAKAAVEEARAQVESAKASLVQTQADYDRYAQLAASDHASRQKLEATRMARDTAKAGVSQAEAGVESAKAEAAVTLARRDEAQAVLARAQAALRSAQLNEAATVIVAPYDGVVGDLSVAKGEFVSPGTRLMALVPLESVHVDANFKETELSEVVPGVPVNLSVDAYPDRKVIGHVESFSPASGSVFSLLPPENATGNFTKVVQRVPVRVSIPADIAAQGWLRPGMSVIATIDTRDSERLREKDKAGETAAAANPPAKPDAATPDAANPDATPSVD